MISIIFLTFEIRRISNCLDVMILKNRPKKVEKSDPNVVKSDLIRTKESNTCADSGQELQADSYSHGAGKLISILSTGSEG